MALTSVRLSKVTWGKIRQIRRLSVERLGEQTEHVSNEELEQVVKGLNEMISESSVGR